MPGAISNWGDFQKMITAYDSSIAYVDHHVQQVLDELDRQGALDDAVLVVSGDHGDAFGRSSRENPPEAVGQPAIRPTARPT
jgi:arylsulfatase A-like enzyme